METREKRRTKKEGDDTTRVLWKWKRRWFLLSGEGLELDEDLIDRDVAASNDVDGLDDTITRSTEHVLHLHGLDDRDLLVDGDLVSDLAGNGDDLSGHGAEETVGEVLLLLHGHELLELLLEGCGNGHIILQTTKKNKHTKTTNTKQSENEERR